MGFFLAAIETGGEIGGARADDDAIGRAFPFGFVHLEAALIDQSDRDIPSGGPAQLQREDLAGMRDLKLSIAIIENDIEPVGFTIAGMGGADKHILAVAQAVEAIFAGQFRAVSGAEPPPKRAKM